jgi:phosphoglycolate phosphatase-like HAD superfamily hydrolase
MQAATGTTYDLADIIVIGDTPKDIRCATALGAKCLAVATGDYTVEELDALKPWRAVPSFTDVSVTVELLMHGE